MSMGRLSREGKARSRLLLVSRLSTTRFSWGRPQKYFQNDCLICARLIYEAVVMGLPSERVPCSSLPALFSIETQRNGQPSYTRSSSIRRPLEILRVSSRPIWTTYASELCPIVASYALAD